MPPYSLLPTSGIPVARPCEVTHIRERLRAPSVSPFLDPAHIGVGTQAHVRTMELGRDLSGDQLV